MKTAIQNAIKEISELWSSPSDQPTYSQIFDILEAKLPEEKKILLTHTRKVSNISIPDTIQMLANNTTTKHLTMETKFTKAMTYFNSIINKVEKGSETYKLMCQLKYRYIQDFS